MCVGPVRVAVVNASAAPKSPQLLLWCHPAVASELAAEIGECITEVVGDADGLDQYLSQLSNFSRFSLRGAGSQRALSQVFWPQCKAQNAIEGHHNSIFIKMLQLEGISNVWGDGFVLNTSAIDVRYLSIKGRRVDAVLVPDPARPSVIVNKSEWARILHQKNPGNTVRLLDF